ncbi:MAG: hypothetical protein ACR2HR_17145 [Euzebya sp.]
MAVAVLLLGVGGCASPGQLGEGPVPTVPQAPAPPVPTLPQSPSPLSPATAGDQGSDPTVPASTPTAAATDAQPVAPPSAGDPFGAVPEDAQALGRELGVDGLVEVLEPDPEQAGDRGEDLLRELRRVQDRPNRNRIDNALDMIEGWLDHDELNAQVAQAALAALEQLRSETGSGDGSDGDEDE